MSNERYSQAFNYLSAVQGGVDSRTGLFNYNFTLGHVIGNDGQGPAFDLSLNYSPVQTKNLYGFGTGVSLSITSFDKKSGMLNTSVGESYRTETLNTGVILPLQQNIKTFTLKKVNSGYIYTQKSGESELLSLIHDDVYLTTRKTSPLGHFLSLHWKYQDGILLEKITDKSGKVLCEISRAGGRILINMLRPSNPKEPPFTVTLDCQNGYLKKIMQGEMTWSLSYDSVNTINKKEILTGIIMPCGGTQSVQYDQQSGHFYPVVKKLTTVPGVEQPPETMTFRYSQNNFMGNRNDLPGTQNDPLFEHIGFYDYWTEETHINSTPTTTAPVVTTRNYNKFHLMTSEIVHHGKAKVHKSIEYNIKPQQSFMGQPADFMFPAKVTLTYEGQNDKGQTISRQEQTQFRYDKDGNLIYKKAPDGTITRVDFYPADGELKGCPPSPHGFVCYIKSQTVFPPLSDKWHDEPAARSIFTYIKLAIPDAPCAIAKHTEIHYAGLPTEAAIRNRKANNDDCRWEDYKASLMSSTSFSYQDDPDKDFVGILSRRDTVLQGSDNKPYTTTETINYSIKNGLITTDNTITTHDGLSLNSQKATSIYTGNRYTEVDAVGNSVNYSYDILGRLLKVTYHPEPSKSQYTSEELYQYELPQPGIPTRTTHTDIRGNKTRISYDGLGREIQYEINDTDNAGINGKENWKVTTRFYWDGLGRKYKKVLTDFLPVSETGKAPQEISLTQITEWDDWGTPTKTTDSEGITSHTLNDPISLTTTSWIEGKEHKVTGKKIGIKDKLTQRPVRNELWDVSSGTAPYSVTKNEWDGAGRLRNATDELGNVTSWQYDLYGRAIATTYPDGTTVYKDYAPFSSAELISEISVKPANGTKFSLGKQTFDGLGRLRSSDSGGRKEVFTYEKSWQDRPTEVTASDGAKRQWKFDPLLGGAPVSMTAGGLSQTFDYDLKTGQLKTARTGQGSLLGYETYPSGRLKKEKTEIMSGGPFATEWKYSLGGLPLKISEEDGNEYRTYNSLGKLTQIQDAAVTVVLEYDAFSRLFKWSATERLSKAVMVVTLSFDNFGREIKRTIHHSNGTERTLTQDWQINNLLSSRKTMAGVNPVLAENYHYDNRNRLVLYICKGTELPSDPYKNKFVKQEFEFDVLNNIKVCRTTLSGGDVNEARYFFENKNDPCQLSGVTNGSPARAKEEALPLATANKTPHGYPEVIRLEYDAAGRMTRDEEGRSLKYDALGRLTTVTGGSYAYDAHNRMVYQKIDKTEAVHRLYYRANRLIGEWITHGADNKPDASKDRRVRLVYAAGGCVAQAEQKEGKTEVMLTGTDAKHSVIIESEGNENKLNTYTPYGYLPRDEDKD